MTTKHDMAEAAFRSICDSDDFVKASFNIAENLKRDLKGGNKAPSEMASDLRRLRNMLRSMHCKSQQRLAMNLGCVFEEPGINVIEKLEKALDHDIPNLEMRSRPALVGSVLLLFLEHGLPINRGKTGPLATYYEFMRDETGFTWPVSQLTRDTHNMFKEGWRPADD